MLHFSVIIQKHQNPTSVNIQYLETANVAIFGNPNGNLTLEGTRNLGTVIENHLYKEIYMGELVTNFNNQLQLLSKIAKRAEPQPVYAAFVSGFKCKLTYFIRTIPDVSELLLPLGHKIRQKFIPAITGGQICSDSETVLLSLPTQYGGLNIPFFHETAKFEYENSMIITKQLTNLIINQDPIHTVNSFEVSKLKSKIKAEKKERHENILQNSEESFSNDQKSLNTPRKGFPLAPWYFQFRVVWLEYVKLSTEY